MGANAGQLIVDLDLFKSMGLTSRDCNATKTIISPSWQELPLRNRKVSLDELKRVLDKELKVAGDRDKGRHTIPVISALSGLGKTRLLIELRKELPLWQPDRNHIFICFIQ